MTHELNDPIPPELTNPAPLGPLAGNHSDDDAEVYESDFDHAPGSAEPQKYAGVPFEKTQLPITTRILQRNVPIGAGADPVLLLPADPNRKQLSIYVDCAAGISATSSFVVADSKNGVYDAGNGIWPWDSTLERGVWINAWEKHTGAVWVHSAGNVALRVVGIAVTE